MKRRTTDRSKRPVTNSKQIKRGARGGWRTKEAKTGRIVRNDG